MMMTLLKAGALALGLVFGAASAPALAGPAAATAIAGPVVKIDNFVFGPQAITVAVGTTVTWVNQDDIPHTVVADDKHSFKSKVLDSDERFSFTFTKPGEYGYFCSLHPHMTGKVIVKAG
jgi:plastocyanin